MATSWTDEGASSPDARVAAFVTSIKGVHVNELRTAIGTERTRRSLGAYSWSWSAVAANTDSILKTHLDELRAAEVDTRTNGFCPTDGTAVPTWTESTITQNVTSTKAQHINELRAALNVMENVSCLCNCNGHCSCNCNGHCR
jgi:hypothetical protein